MHNSINTDFEIMDNKIKHFLSAGIIGILMLFLITNSSVAGESKLKATIEDSSRVFSVVDKMPQIIGGISELYDLIQYPKAARDRQVEGKVFVQFIVDSNGNVTEPKILKDIGFGCGEAAIEAISSIKFTPGSHEGVEVPVNYTLPVLFKLKE